VRKNKFYKLKSALNSNLFFETKQNKIDKMIEFDMTYFGGSKGELGELQNIKVLAKKVE